MSRAFMKTFVAGWGLMDSNAHMANTAYLDFAADCRMIYFKENGFPMSEFVKRGIGPVIRRDEVEYMREVRLLEEVAVELRLAGISADGSRFCFENTFLREDGKTAAAVRSIGGWMDMKARSLTVPPDELLALIRALARTDDFQELPSSIRAAS
jgi:acyl-CoA thioester hydrolase